MPNPRLANRYAKSLIDLATSQNQLEAVYKDMQYLQSVCKTSTEFVRVMRSPIINPDKKQKILATLAEGRLTNITALFNKLLVSKTREEFLPEIVHAFIEQYNALKGIHTVKLTTAEAVSEELKQSIVNKIRSETALQNIELQTEVKDELIGGFVLEFNNNLVDASISRDLRDIKKQFRENIYIQQIR